MKSKFKTFLLFISCFLSMLSYGQKQSISGTINDGNLPLPGASITINGTIKTAVTDWDGKFLVTDVPVGELTLKITYLGYVGIERQISIKENQQFNIGTITLIPEHKELNEVVVVAQNLRNSESRALNMQKNSVSIMNVIAADGIGKLPDRNAAETVQRIQGVSIEKDQGEGRFVSVRGLPPFWASTTINGNRIPTAEEETTSRATAFDFFPSELIAYVQVNKAITPDIEADGIGGSVNFITQTPPEKTTISATLGSGYNTKSDKGIYNISATLGGKTKDKKFGYLINLTQWNRNWATDNFEARRDGDEGVFRLELRDYTGIRKTTGINSAFEYSISPKNKIYLKSLYGTLADNETHYKHRIRFDKFNSATNVARVELQNIHNELITELKAVNFGGKHELSSGKIDWDLAVYENEFRYGNIPDRENKSYYVVKFRQDGVGINPNYISDKGKGPRAYWSVDGGQLDYKDTDALFGFYSNPDFKMDASKMKFSDLEFYKISIIERDNIVAAFNHEFTTSEKLSFKYGLKFRDKDRRAKFEDVFYTWSSTNPAPYLSNYAQYITEQPGRTDYLTEINATVSNSFGPVLSTQGMNQFWNENQNNVSVSTADSEGLAFNSGLGRNFDVDETHAAAYGMGTYTISDKLTLLGGIRAENTTTKVSGYNVVNGDLLKVQNKKEYLAVLPMIHVKYSPTNDMNLRFAATRTFARPNYGDITPGGSYVEADNEFKGGNPSLNPTYSLNFDLMGDYYFSNVGTINVGLFYKSITDPIFQDTYRASYNGNTGVEFSTPNNGDNAWIGGFEAGITKRFDFLPGFLKYFGTQLNTTLMTSEMTKPSGRNVNLPYQAKQIYNAQLFFEKGGCNVRLAFNHKGKYAIAYGESDIDDVYYGKYSSLDLGLQVKLTKHISIYTDINNILNEPLIYHYGASEDRPKQVEYYGIKGSFGTKFNF
ncbi:TonB-dependent receptor [Flavobacterium sp.]|uniref:TonB-dependent receptor n=1 Tax=Flavobacterium sp. TaxID=239 RepID=UPI003D6B0FEE